MKCPNCGAELHLNLVMEAVGTSTKTSAVGKTINFKMKGISYSSSDKEIIEAAKNLQSPETIRDYYVELADGKGVVQEFPIKQVVRKALQTAYKGKFAEDYFTSQRARHVLTKLGFVVKSKR